MPGSDFDIEIRPVGTKLKPTPVDNATWYHIISAPSDRVILTMFFKSGAQEIINRPVDAAGERTSGIKGFTLEGDVEGPAVIWFGSERDLPVGFGNGGGKGIATQKPDAYTGATIVVPATSTDVSSIASLLPAPPSGKTISCISVTWSIPSTALSDIIFVGTENIGSGSGAPVQPGGAVSVDISPSDNPDSEIANSSGGAVTVALLLGYVIN